MMFQFMIINDKFLTKNVQIRHNIISVILNLPPITIHQEDPAASNCACLEESQVFRKGKSCLFALPTIVLEKQLHSFPITMSVYKKLPPGVLPDVIVIGSSMIETKDLINSLLNKQVFKSGNPCKSMKDTFKLTTPTGQLVGDATIFIRASCFGSKIVTQFQIPHNKKPYLFKGNDESPIFQCKRIPSNLPSSTSPKCTCPSKSIKQDAGGGNQRKNCCATPVPPPPPPTPIKMFDTPGKTPYRPCCPTLQGQMCPGASVLSSRDKMLRGSPAQQLNNSKSVFGASSGAQKKCGCSGGRS